MTIEKELATLKLVKESSAIGYFFKRLYYSYFDFSKKYDQNILNIVDVAIQTKRYKFIYKLDAELKKLKETADKTAFLEKLLIVFNAEIQQQSAAGPEDAGLKQIKKSINKYIDDHGFEQDFIISKKDKDIFNSSDLTKQDRDKRRRNKTIFGVVAFALAFLVAFPEGALAVYGLGVFAIGPMILVGLSAFAVSYFLYKADLYQLLKNFFYPTSEPEEFKSLAKSTKAVLMFFVVFAAIAMGILLFSSIYVPAGMLIFGFASAAALFAAPISAGLAGLMAVAAFFAVLTALANVAIFKPICYKTYVDLKSSLKGFKAKDLLSLKPLIIVLSIAVMIFGQLWFGSEAYNISHIMLGLSQKASLITASLVGVLGVINGLFYGKNLYNFLTGVKDFVVVRVKKLIYPEPETGYIAVNPHTTFTDKNAANLQAARDFDAIVHADKWRLSAKRTAINVSRIAAIVVLIGCCVGNATGVATGVAALMGGYVILKKLAFGLISTASFSANGKASYEAFDLPASPQPKLAQRQEHKPKEQSTKPVETYTVYFKTKTQSAESKSVDEFVPMFPVPSAPAA